MGKEQCTTPFFYYLLLTNHNIDPAELIISARNSAARVGNTSGPVVSHYIGNNIPVVSNSRAIEVEKPPDNPEELRPSFVGSDGTTYVLDIETEEYRPLDEGVAEEHYYGDETRDIQVEVAPSDVHVAIGRPVNNRNERELDKDPR